MRKMKRILAALAALVMVLAACGTAAAEQEARKIESAADAEEWIAAFLSEHPEEMDGVWAMAPMMEAAVTAAGGMKGIAASLSMLGTAEEIGQAREGEIKGYKAYYIPCVFSVMPVDLILVVQDGAVAGLNTGAYSGEAKKEETEPDTFESIELALEAPGLGSLPGILTVPAGEGPFPVVVLLQGSGPADKDETLGDLKPFRDLAEGLAAQGVAAYRFDKRTYAFSGQLAGKKDISLEDEYIEDAVNAVRLLAEQEKIDPDRIWVLGHSLGGNAVPAIARTLRQEQAGVRGFVMMAASPRPTEVLMREQYEFLYSLMPEVPEEMQAQKDELFAELDRLKDLDSLAEDDKVAGVYSSYWKWLADYDIVQAAQEITEPVLLLQGEEDYQVTMEDFALWQEAVGGKDNWELVSFPGLTHMFMPGKKEEGSAAYTREAKMDAQVIGDIADFIHSR